MSCGQPTWFGGVSIGGFLYALFLLRRSLFFSIMTTRLPAPPSASMSSISDCFIAVLCSCDINFLPPILLWIIFLMMLYFLINCLKERYFSTPLKSMKNLYVSHIGIQRNNNLLLPTVSFFSESPSFIAKRFRLAWNFLCWIN